MSDDDQEIEDLHSFDDYYGTLNVSREVSNLMELLCKLHTVPNPRYFICYDRQQQTKLTLRIGIFHDNFIQTSIKRPRISQVLKLYSIESRRLMKFFPIHILERSLTTWDTKVSKRRVGKSFNDRKLPQNFVTNMNG